LISTFYYHVPVRLESIPFYLLYIPESSYVASTSTSQLDPLALSPYVLLIRSSSSCSRECVLVCTIRRCRILFESCKAYKVWRPSRYVYQLKIGWAQYDYHITDFVGFVHCSFEGLTFLLLNRISFCLSECHFEAPILFRAVTYLPIGCPVRHPNTHLPFMLFTGDVLQKWEFKSAPVAIKEQERWYTFPSVEKVQPIHEF
jgi:hypothetical protein